ncbi:M56 family metallopeptidase [Lysobacter sp. TAB13]|uniref:M56 family metallopeptidase n=1 Tax=Lysobacter sp. TAB13 TaxID=3233065 RepID=UPI003F983A0E
MSLDWIGETLLPRLVAAGLQSLLVVAAVWLLCRYLRLSAAMRCWLWWSAALQLLLGALWPTPLSLPLLPASWSDAALTAQPAPPLSSAAQLPYFVTRADLTAAPAVGEQMAGADWLSWPLVFAALWLSGFVLVAIASARGYAAARRRVAESQPCEQAHVLRAYRALGDSLGLRRLPPLRLSAQIHSPQLIGPWPAAVLLPDARTPQLNSEELSMALHHELVHVRRRDLWWGWVPAMVQHLFFFHPLAHVIAREYSIAREAACDAAVLESQRYAAHDYGRLLLRLGVAPRPAAGVASASPTYVVLKRRLTMLQNATSSSHIGGLVLTAAVVLLGLVPYRVTAAAGERAPKTQSQTVSIHSDSRDGETRITELKGGGKPEIWAVKGGEYYRVGDDGRYEIVRDPATRARLQQRMSDAKQAGVDAERASREAAKAMREAEQAGREAEQAGRDAERAGRQAERDAEAASREAQRAAANARREALDAQREARDAARQAQEEGQRAREQGHRDAEQAQRDAAQARRDAEQARREAQREGERARIDAQREAQQARQSAQRDAQQARQQAQRDGEQARREAQLDHDQALREAAQARRDAQQQIRDAERVRRDATRYVPDSAQIRSIAEQARRDAQRQTADSAQIRRDALRAGNEARQQVDVEKIRRDALQQRVDVEKIRRDAIRAAREAVEQSERDLSDANASL